MENNIIPKGENIFLYYIHVGPTCVENPVGILFSIEKFFIKVNIS